MSLRDLVTARSRSRSTTTSFIGLLDEHLTTAEQKPRRPGFHPSQLSYDFCPRFYALLGLGLLIGIKVIDARLQRIFDNGHALHDRYQKYSRDMGIVFDHPVLKRRGKKVGRQKFAQEVRLDHPVGITGNCDDVLFVDGFMEVVDYKSINPQRFGALLEPTESHEKQLTIYVGLMSHLFDGKPPRPLRGRMVYEDKGCVPPSARILTREGWKTHDQLTTRDEILTYNVAQDALEWEPFRQKVVYDDVDTLYRVGNKHQSFLATDNHRWVVEDHRGNRSIRHTTELNSNSWVPRVAPYRAPLDTILTAYEAEVLGWLASDGHVTKSGTVAIYQSKEVGVEALSALLRPEDYTFHTYVQKYRPSSSIAHFTLRGDLREKLVGVYRDREDLPRLLTRMSREALEAFWRGALGGDGSWSSSGTKVQICARRADKKEAFQLAAFLLGMPINTNPAVSGNYVSNRRRFRTYAPEPVEYGGQVWCPVTQNGTWVMEQDGKVCITGNSQALKEFIVPWDDDHRAWFDQLIAYLEIVNQAVEQDTPELAPCTCGKCDAYDIKALRVKPKEVKL